MFPVPITRYIVLCYVTLRVVAGFWDFSFHDGYSQTVLVSFRWFAEAVCITVPQWYSNIPPSDSPHVFPAVMSSRPEQSRQRPTDYAVLKPDRGHSAVFHWRGWRWSSTLFWMDF